MGPVDVMSSIAFSCGTASVASISLTKAGTPILMENHDDHAFDLASRLRKRRQGRPRTFKRPACRDRAANCAPLSHTNKGRSPTQARGDLYEMAAARLLMGSGCEILGRQLRCRFGEIDLAVRDGSSLVWVEVRSSQTMRYGGAVASVGHLKQKRLILTAGWWMQTLTRTHFDGVTPPCRFDLIAF